VRNGVQHDAWLCPSRQREESICQNSRVTTFPLVWVGFIALFGAAAKKGGVMVIYLEEAVARKKATGEFPVRGLHEAVMEGVLLCLRPKVMTVLTVGD
jgi:Cu/Ag efflux pump CusA